MAFAFGAYGCSGWAMVLLNSTLGPFAEMIGSREENRRRALHALRRLVFLGRLISPRQVHGDHVVGGSATDAAVSLATEAEGRRRCHRVLHRGVPVLLCFADCVPVVLVSQGASLKSCTRAGAAPLARRSPPQRLGPCRGEWVRFEDLCPYLGASHRRRGL